MNSSAARPGRSLTGSLALLVVVLLFAFDLLQAEPIDPYQAPWPTALGSGQAPSGAHCTDISGLQ